jgi:hypothetical protein
MALYDNEVMIVWMGDGVFFPLKTSDKTTTQSFLRLMKDLNITLIVDFDELHLRGFSRQDIMPEAETKPHDEIIELLATADTVISF